MLRAVVDTNVLLEGLTRKKDPGRVVDAWAARRFLPCVSTALALEYEEVLVDKFGAARRDQVLGALQALLTRVEFTPILSRVRPLSPDPDDDFVIECAFNANALIVTHDVRDFAVANSALGIVVVTAIEFLTMLEKK